MLTKEKAKQETGAKKTRHISYYNEESHFDPRQYNMTTFREIFESYNDYRNSKSWE